MAHLLVSLGWVGALLVFLAHATAGAFSSDVQAVRAAAWAMDVTAWLVILPLSVATVATGIVQATGTSWGLFRHYWIVFKLLLTAVATAVLLLKLGPISALAAAAGEWEFALGDMQRARASLLAHAIGGLVVLLAVALLGVYKPEGLTNWGLSVGGLPTAPTGRPRWVKVAAGGAGALLLLVFLMVVAGRHGPGVPLHG